MSLRTSHVPLLAECETPPLHLGVIESISHVLAKTLPHDVGQRPVAETFPERIGPYRLQREIGRGGMGVVYQAHDIRLNRTVALKVILGMEFSDPARLLRFQDEALAIAHLKHPNIVQVFDTGTHEQLPYMALEYVESGSLHAKCASKPQEPSYAATLVAAIADGIHHAHEHGVLHRDLKPANILLRSSKEEGRSSKSNHAVVCEVPVVTDFGLAKRIDSKEYFTQSGQAVGTPSYMAPEQASGQREKVGVAADVYGLGAILYELLTGRPPLEGVTPVETLMQVLCKEPVPPRQLQPKVPVDLETICLKCLQKDPGKRYSSAAALADDLRRFLRNEVILARPASKLERVTRWCFRHPAFAGLLAIIATLLVSGTAVSSFFAYQSSLRSEQLSKEKENVAREKEKTTRNLHRARTIIREYLADVDENSALKDLLSEPVKQQLLSKAIPVLKELLEENSNTAELLVEQAKAQWLLGRIHASMGEASQAEAAFRASIHACQELTQSPESMEQLGQSYFSLGCLLQSQGSYEAALKEFAGAIHSAETLPALSHQDARPRLLVKTNLKMAELHLGLSNVPAATIALNQAGALAKASGYESRVNYLTDRIEVLLQHAKAETRTGLYTVAESRSNEALQLSQERWNHSSTLNELNHTRGQVAYRLAMIHAQQRQFPEAEKQINQAIEQVSQCVADKPLAYSFQLTLAQAYRLRAHIQQDKLKPEKAGSDLKKSREMYETLANLNPTFQCRSEYARSLADWGKYSFQMKEFKVAEEYQTKAMERFTELTTIMPGDIELLSAAAENLNALGCTVLRDPQRLQQAITHLTQAESAYATLFRLTPRTVGYRTMHGGVCANLGNCHLLERNYPRAEAMYRQSMELLLPVLETKLDPYTTQDYLRIAKKGMGSVCLMTDRFEESVEWYEQAMPLCSRDAQRSELRLFLDLAKQKRKP